MSDLDLQKLEELIIKSIQTKDKKPLFDFGTVVKMALTLIMFIFAYAGMSNKVDNAADNIKDIKQSQKDEKKDNDLQRQSMMVQIQTCQTEIAIMKEQLKDLKEMEDLKK